MTPAELHSPASLEKRAKILEIARKRMSHYGVSKTTMAEIAVEADVAVGTLYLYFKNKDDIVLALAQQCREEQDAFLHSILEDSTHSPSEKLETFLLEKFRYVTAFRTETPHGKELIAYLVQNFPESLNEWEQRLENAIQTILEQGVSQHAFFLENPCEAARLLRIATSSFFPLPYLELPKYPKEEDLLTVIRWFLHTWQREHP